MDRNLRAESRRASDVDADDMRLEWERLAPQAATTLGGLTAQRLGVQLAVMNEPLRETRNRKPLTNSPHAPWEVRVQPFRMYYEVDEETKTVYIFAVVYKPREKVYRRGREIETRE